VTLTLEQRLLMEQCRAYQPVPEFRAVPGRRFRIDVAFPPQKLAVEIDGGAWIRGRHSRGVGIESDCEKSAALAILGWRLIRCTPQQVQKGLVFGWVRQALENVA
jgi:very-short-patch-repair endonuclease